MAYIPYNKRIDASVSDMKGLTIEEIEGMESGSDHVTFNTVCGKKFHMWYEQDCCASCDIADVAGDVSDLIGSPLLMSEEVSDASYEAMHKCEDYESCTWTFYKFATQKGYVTLRWFGSSNGYYSESTSFCRTK